LRACSSLVAPGARDEIGYQNTWALSKEVETYLKSLEPTGRRRIGPAEVQAIEDLPGENYLVDIETALYDVTFHYKLPRDWTAYAIASAITYQGGVLDSTIESFTTPSASAASADPARRARAWIWERIPTCVFDTP
jgi:hypothetical protein